MAKIIEKITDLEKEGKKWFSLEFFPPKFDHAVEPLVERVANFSRLGPLFVDITWGAGGSTADRTIELSDIFQNVVGVETQMHITCTNMPQEKVLQGLKRAYDAGIRNLLCLRGDPPRGADTWTAVEGGFSCAADLIRFVRQEYKDYFSIAVAGYPEGHPDGNYEADLGYLQQKIDAGANIIITQLFYDTEQFLKFVSDCRARGITAPIVPGIMPIQNYGSFKRMVQLCKVNVPQDVLDALEPIQNDDQAVKAYGVALAVKMCRRLMEGGIQGFHFYTMNLERAITDIVSELGLAATTPRIRQLPWTASSAPRRSTEDVRPIFWSNRPRSYLARTDAWDDFPNGRWGDLRSPAFGELSDSHYGRINTENSESLRKIYGAPVSEPDVFSRFAAYLRGEIPRLPWNEVQLAPESSFIRDRLIQLNEAGFLTTNSQPAVNGAPSTDPIVGWGKAGGYVFQKAYIEFFTSAERLEKLKAALARFPSLELVAANAKGEVFSNITREHNVTAVTWGVFPGSEILQPTVVDNVTFVAWRDEAFQLWLAGWARLYPEGSESEQLLHRIHDSYYLVSIVDNDFMKPNHVFEIFDEIAQQA